MSKLDKDYMTLGGKKFQDITPTEKKTLYAWNLWMDGASERIALDSAQASTQEFMNKQLCNTFGYTDDQIIQ